MARNNTRKINAPQQRADGTTTLAAAAAAATAATAAATVATAAATTVGETGNQSLRKAFRENNEQPLKIGFDYEDLGTFHPLGNFSGMLNSLMGETVRSLPLACEWEEIPEAYKAHIYPTLEKVDKGYYEDLIETWRKGHSNKKTGQFKTTENEQRYLDMKAMKDNIKAGLIPFKTDQEILDEIVLSDNRQNMSGMGRKLPGGGSTSRRRANRAFGDIMTRDQITQMFRQQEQEKELHRKQVEEAHARAYLASLKADATDQRANVAQQNSEANNAALAERPHYILQTNPHMNDSRSCKQLAQDLAHENNNESSGEEEEDEKRTGGDDDYSDDDDYDE
ncbi:hypothetical protein Tco_1023581 [Tanacetum coccineum]